MSAPLRAILAASVFAVLLPVAACDANDGARGADAALSEPHSRDASAGDAAASDAHDAHDAGLCCPVDPPSNACDCTRLGGIPDALGRCPRAPCDLGRKYAAYVDENGCAALKVVPDDGTIRCNAPPPRDAGSDAQPDAASTDAGAP